MTMLTDAIQRVSELPEEAFSLPAAYAARQLKELGVAEVRLTPGDMTEYRFVLAKPRFFWSRDGLSVRTHGSIYVSLWNAFGLSAPWTNGDEDDPDACRRLWTTFDPDSGTGAYAGAIISRFLTSVRREMTRE